MIDLHCHLLPGIDDGPASVSASLEMARQAVSDGTSTVACTPHIFPGVYDNTGAGIRAAVVKLQHELDRAGISLAVTTGADVHVAPDILEGLNSGRILSIAESRYFLLEPPQVVVPPRFENLLFRLVGAGYVPIVTHPERLAWPERAYDLFGQTVRLGGWLQLTAGSLLGQFGRRARALSERLLSDGLVHIIASDAHNKTSRPPLLSAAFEAAASLIGEEQALHLVRTRPAGILADVDPCELPPPIGVRSSSDIGRRRLMRRAGE